MPILSNARHERFAQAIATGKNALQAHEIAGYKADDGNASKLAARPDVAARVQEITGAAAEKTGITAERVLTELARIGFADIRKAVEWHGSLIREQDQPDGGDVLVIKEIFSNHVRLVDSDGIDEDTAAAIAEVRQSPTGGLSIKLHDKRAALVDLGKHLGMFKERIEHTGPDGGPIATTSDVVLSKLSVEHLEQLKAILEGADKPTAEPAPVVGTHTKSKRHKARTRKTAAR